MAPNWFASVMGTGIVANAALLLPHRFEGARPFAAVRVGVRRRAAGRARHAERCVRWREARTHLLDPAMAPFYGAPAMALMTVGAGSLLLGLSRLAVDVVLWTAGTLLGLAVAVAVPYLMFTRHDLAPDSAFGGWLMPVVSPMVSAATGAALIDRMPAGEARLDLLLGVLRDVRAEPAGRVRRDHGALEQAAAARGRAGAAGADAVDRARAARPVDHGREPAGRRRREPPGRARVRRALRRAGPRASRCCGWRSRRAITVHTARTQGLPFSLTWWSFTFPVGTVVTGTSELSAPHRLGGARLARRRAVRLPRRRLADRGGQHRQNGPR